MSSYGSERGSKTSIMFKKVFNVLILLVWLLSDSSETNSLKKLTTNLEEYSSQFPHEKVYVHTDRDVYGAGERIWLKSYLTVGAFNQPSPISNNVHLELYAPDKSLISKTLLKSIDGFSAGSIDLLPGLSPGSYLLRGYTNWMLNFDKDFLFEKEIVILSDEAITNDQRPVDEATALDFFPEGGYLVEKVPGRVAFKAIGSDGLSKPVSGKVFDTKGSEILQFESSYQGMGIFVLNPSPGESYHAIINETQQKVDLPVVLPQGVSISVNNKMEDILRLTFRSNEKTMGKENLSVIIQSGGAISYAFELDLSNNIAFKTVSKQNIPGGIAHITVFDKNGNPLVERLAFVKKRTFNVSIETDKEIYDTREKITATVKILDNEGLPVQAGFSLAALDSRQIMTIKSSENIKSNLLLTSDLKGYIENPSYYFEEATPERSNHLDLVMMTHGWRRFSWLQILNKEWPDIDHLIEKGLSIKGKLVDKFSKKPIPNGSVTYFDKSMVPPLTEKVKTDANGDWEILNILAYDDKPIILQGENKRGKKMVSFEIDTTMNLQTPKSWVQNVPKDDSEVEFLIEQAQKRQLIDESYDYDSTATIVEGVTVEVNRYISQQRKSAFGYGTSTLGFDELPEEFTLTRNPLEAIQGRLSGVLITGSGLNMRVNIRGATTTNMGDPLPPLIMLDEVRTGLQTILSTPSIDIERVEVYKGPDAAIFGSQGNGGALLFYTKNGSRGRTQPAEGMYTTLLRNAYHNQKQFYAPVYEVKLPEHVKPDQRAVLHWEPMGMTDEDGTAKIEFWNSDMNTTVLINLQGLTLTGRPVMANTTYTIR